MFVLAPVIARPVMKVLGVRKVSGATGHLAVENARRNPRRTAATASALMIGVALVGFITVVASSTKASTAEAVDTSLRADYVVDSGSWGNGGFGTTIEGDLAAVPGVETVSPMRSTPVNIGEGSSEVLAVDTATIDELMDLEVVEGSLPEVHGDSIALWTERAEELGLGLATPSPWASRPPVTSTSPSGRSTKGRSSVPATASTSSASTPSTPTSRTSSTARCT